MWVIGDHNVSLMYLTLWEGEIRYTNFYTCLSAFNVLGLVASTILFGLSGFGFTKSLIANSKNK